MAKMKRRIKATNPQKAKSERTIDLHEKTSMQAFNIVIEAITYMHETGGGRIKFITGIGNEQRGTGVIKNEFPIWLEHFKISEFIVNFTYSSGVYLVKVR